MLDPLAFPLYLNCEYDEKDNSFIIIFDVFFFSIGDVVKVFALFNIRFLRESGQFFPAIIMISYKGLIDKLDPNAKKTEYSIANGKLCVVVHETEENYEVRILSDVDHLTLHWGLGIKNAKDWVCPLTVPGVESPVHTVKFDEKAAQTPFVEIIPSLSTFDILFAKENAPLQVNFVVKRESVWFNNNNKNYEVPLKVPEPVVISADTDVKNMVNEIINSEMNYGS